MQTFKAIKNIALTNIIKWLADPKIYVMLILMLFVVAQDLEPIFPFAEQLGYPIPIWFLSTIFGVPYFNLILNFGIVLLLSGAPFLDIGQTTVILRSGKKIWTVAQLFYIFLSCIIYYLVLFLVCILFAIPHLGFSKDWGEVLYTLAMSGETRYSISRRLVLIYSPFSALIHTFFLRVLFGTFLGCLMFALNFFTAKPVGTLVATIFILSSLVRPGPIAVIYPGHLMDLSKTPSVAYSYLFFIFTIAILGIISVKLVSKREIRV